MNMCTPGRPVQHVHKHVEGLILHLQATLQMLEVAGSSVLRMSLAL